MNMTIDIGPNLVEGSEYRLYINRVPIETGTVEYDGQVDELVHKLALELQLQAKTMAIRISARAI